MSSKSHIPDDTDDTVLHTMLEEMKEARACLRNQDLDGAVDAIDGMTEETDCSICTRVEIHCLGGLAWIRVSPDGRKGSTAKKVIEELDHYIETLEGL